jgi:hypothetical protein
MPNRAKDAAADRKGLANRNEEADDSSGDDKDAHDGSSGPPPG